jgi:uncharacterized membrane protein
MIAPIFLIAASIGGRYGVNLKKEIRIIGYNYLL